jgi:hypothetical protein
MRIEMAYDIKARRFYVKYVPSNRELKESIKYFTSREAAEQYWSSMINDIRFMEGHGYISAV